VIVLLLVPLFPLGFEMSLGPLTLRSLTITAAIYAIAVGASSESILVLILSVAASILFAFEHGVSAIIDIVQAQESIQQSSTSSTIVIPVSTVNRG
jgi:hypothetical protein